VDGFFADAAVTVPVGAIDPSLERLLRITRESLERGIAAAQVGERLSSISVAVQRHVEAAGYSVVRQFVGHGIGRQLHEDPPVPNYGEPNRGPRLKVGMVLAIEPMVNIGGADVHILADGWTVVTDDGSLSAHFEHTVAMTDDGPCVLTVP
jgi:methionyl aminopeptidase